MTKNKDKRDYKLRERGKLRKLILLYLSEHPCVDCNERDPIVLEFDHMRGQKICSVARMVNDVKPWNTILEEILKCDVRCANCHRRKTHSQLSFWKQL